MHPWARTSDEMNYKTTSHLIIYIHQSNYAAGSCNHIDHLWGIWPQMTTVILYIQHDVLISHDGHKLRCTLKMTCICKGAFPIDATRLIRATKIKRPPQIMNESFHTTSVKRQTTNVKRPRILRVFLCRFYSLVRPSNKYWPIKVEQLI